jgi:hypothetical protein
MFAIALLLAVLVGVPSGASGQVSTTRGLSLGVYFQGASLSVEGGDPGNGGGGGLRVGYGINRTVTLFIRADGSQTDVEDATIVGQWTLAHGELGARFHFANALRRWVPFLEVAAGARTVSVNDATVEGGSPADVSFSGGAFSLGGGLGVYFNQTVALDLGLIWTGGEFTDIDVGNVTVSGFDIDARSFRFNLGLTFWP